MIEFGDTRPPMCPKQPENRDEGEKRGLWYYQKSMEKTMKQLLKILLALILAASSFADERKEAMDFYILYDRSLSMRLQGKETDAANWLISSFLGPVVIPGDNVYVISFFKTAESVWEGPITSDADKKELMRRISALKPNGVYTDIGNALDALKKRLEGAMSNGRKKYILLLTDEIQEAPPGSPYFSKDGTFSHAYLTYVRREQHGAWKVITIGVGIDDKINKSVEELATVLTSLPAERLKDADPRLIGPDAQGKTTDSGLSAAAAKEATSDLIGKILPIAAIAMGALAALAILVFVLAKRVRSKKDGLEKADERENVAPRRN
jgi:hypothetical protein